MDNVLGDNKQRHQRSYISYRQGAGPEQSWVTCLPASVLLFPPQASSRIDCGAGWRLLLWDRDNVKLSPTVPTVKHLCACCERAFKHPPKPLMPSSHAVAVATQHLLPDLLSTSSSFCWSLSIPQRILERKPFNPSKPPNYTFKANSCYSIFIGFIIISKLPSKKPLPMSLFCLCTWWNMNVLYSFIGVCKGRPISTCSSVATAWRWPAFTLLYDMILNVQNINKYVAART